MQSKVGLIVDGAGDYAAFKARFSPGVKILKTDGPRSHTTTIEQIVSYSRKQVTMLQAYSCSVIIVVLDFERRSIQYQDFAAQLGDAFARAFTGLSVYAAVPNQSLENWYLADIAHLSKKRQFLRTVSRQKSYEGKAGKDVLKGLFRKGYSYSEVAHGPQLFCLLRFDQARRFSDSLDRFLAVLLPALRNPCNAGS